MSNLRSQNDSLKTAVTDPRELSNTIGLGGTLLAGGAVGIIVSMVLPWASTKVLETSISVMGIRTGYGQFSLIAAAAGLAILYLAHFAEVKNDLREKLPLASLIAGGIMVLMPLLCWLRLGSFTGWGTFLALVSGGVALAGGILRFQQK